MPYPQEISPQFFDTLADNYGLSHAELEVLSLVLQLESPSAIADSLSLNNSAVRKRLSEVYHKVGIEGKGPVKFAKLQKCLWSLYNTQVEAPDQPNNNDHDMSSESQVGSVDWNNAPDVSRFTGRSNELALLNEWTIQQKCRLVGIFGLQGVGKTTLAVKIAQQIQEQFDYVIWRSLNPSLTPNLFFSQLIQFFHQQENLAYQPGKRNINEQINWLTNYLRSHRCLLVLDGFETLFKKGELAGIYRKGYDAYGKFLWRFAQESSKSCCIITSREKSRELCVLEDNGGMTHSLTLKGLKEDAYSLLQNKSLSKQEAWNEFIDIYQGNPLMLKLASMTIKEVFEGNVGDFLATTRLTDEITHLVYEMLTRLSPLEYNITMSMAQEETTNNVQQIQEKLDGIRAKDVLKAVQSLKMRSLIENSNGGFQLIPIIKEAIQS